MPEATYVSPIGGWSPPTNSTAERIGLQLESLIPEVRSRLGERDFRSRDRNEIIGGVCYDSRHAAANPQGPFLYRVPFGGEQKCLQAKVALEKLGIAAVITKTSAIDGLFQIAFELAADWEPPPVTHARLLELEQAGRAAHSPLGEMLVEAVTQLRERLK